MRRLRRVLVVAATELRLRRRRPLALLLALLAPALLATLVGLSLGTLRAPELRLAVTGPDAVAAGTLAAVEARATQTGGLTVRSVTDEGAGRQALRQGHVDAVLVLPDPAADPPAEVTVLVGPGTGSAATVAERIGDLVAARLDAGFAVAVGVRGDVVTPVDRTEVDAQPGGGRLAQAVTVMMAYFVAGQASEAMLRNRERGILDRLAPSTVRPGEVLVGTLLVVVGLGLAATTIAFAAIALAFGDLRWGPWPGVALLTVATVGAVSALGLLPAGLVRTPAQAQGATALLAFGTALASGSLTLPDQVSPEVQTIRRATPNGWSLDGLTQLAVENSIRSALPSVIALLGVAAAALALAWLLAARRAP